MSDEFDDMIDSALATFEPVDEIDEMINRKLGLMSELETRQQKQSGIEQQKQIDWVAEDIQGVPTSLGKRLYSGMAQGSNDLVSLGQRVLGEDDLADESNRTSAIISPAANVADKDSLMPEWFGEGIQGVARTAPSMIVASQAGPAAVIALAASNSYNQALTEGKDAGLSPEETEKYAARHAIIEGGITAAFQMVGLGGAESALRKEAVKLGWKQAALQFGKQGLAELGEEELIGFSQAFNTALSEVNPDAITPENLKKMAWQTAVQTGLTMGLMKAPGMVDSALDARAEKQAGLDGLMAEVNAQNQQQVDGMNAAPVEAEPDTWTTWANSNPDAAMNLAQKESPSRKDFEQAGFPKGNYTKEERAAITRLLRNEVFADALPSDGVTQTDDPGVRVNQEARRADLEEGMQKKVDPAIEQIAQLGAELGRLPTKNEVLAKTGYKSREFAGRLIREAFPDGYGKQEAAAPEVATKPEDEKPGSPAFFAKRKAQIAESVASITSAAGDATVVQMQGPDGRSAIVHPTSYEGRKGQYQISWIDKDGTPSGHVFAPNREAALKSMAGEGHLPYGQDGKWKVSGTRGRIEAEAPKVARKRFQSEEELSIERLRARGWTDEDLAETKAEGLFARDNVTGFVEARSGTARMKTIERAIKHAEDTKESALYVELDLRNLGGINAKKGHEGANKVYSDIARIIKEETESASKDGDLNLFRHGGDEMSAVMVNVSPEAAQAAVERAQQRVAEYATKEELDDAHKPETPDKRGTGIHFYIQQIGGDAKAHEVVSQADKALEAKKKGLANVTAKQAAAVKPDASGKQSTGTESGTTEATEQSAGTVASGENVESGSARTGTEGAGSEVTQTRAELAAEAKKLGVTKTGTMSKADLAEVVKIARGEMKPPTLEDFETPKKGHNVEFEPRDAMGGSRGLRKTLKGKIVGIEQGRALVRDGGGAQWTLPMNAVRRPKAQLYADLKNATARYERIAFTKEERNAAADTRKAFAAVNGETVQAVTQEDYNIQNKEARDRTLTEHGFATDTRGQAQALPKLVSDMLMNAQDGKATVPESFETFHIATGISQGDKVTFAGKQWDVELTPDETIRYVREGESYEFPRGRAPLDIGTNRAPRKPLESPNTNDDDFPAIKGMQAPKEPKTGKPYSVKAYHGTTQSFSEFDTSKLGENTGSDSAKEAFFFTDSKAVSESYANVGRRPNEKAWSKWVGDLNDDSLLNIARYFAQKRWGSFAPIGSTWSDTDREYARNELLSKAFSHDSIEQRFDADQIIEAATAAGIKPPATPFEGMGNVVEQNIKFSNPMVIDADGQSASELNLGDAIRKAKSEGRDGVVVLRVSDAITAPDEKNPPLSNVFIPFNLPKSDDSVKSRTLPAQGNPFNVKTKTEGADNDISNHEIVAQLSRDFNVPFRNGRLPPGHTRSAGVYKEGPEAIRLKRGFEGDLAVATHEVAHHIDKLQNISKTQKGAVESELRSLDYDPSKGRVFEGFAEYVRHYMTDDDAATFAPLFHKVFTEQILPSNPDLKAKLELSKRLIDNWREQSAEARVKANISTTGKQAEAAEVGLKDRFTDTAKRWWDRLYAAAKNEGHYLFNAEKAARSKGYKPKPGDSAYDLYMALSQAGPTLAGRAIDEGVFSITGKMEKIGPSLKEVFADVPAEQQDTLVAWMYARHAIEVWDKSKNPGISRADAEHVFNKYNSPEFEAAANKFTEFNNALIEMLRDAGVIDMKTSITIQDSWETYIPLKRARESTAPGGSGGPKLVNMGNVLKGRKGSGLQIIDPVQSTIERAVQFYQRAAKQQVIQEIVKMSKNEGMAGWIEEVPPGQKVVQFTAEQVKGQLAALGVDPQDLENIHPDEMMHISQPDFANVNGKPIARVMVDGKPKLFEFDPDLFRSVTGMDFYRLPGWAGMIASAGRLFKTGVTGLNPNFIAANIVRDYGGFLMQRNAAKGLSGHADPGLMMASYAYSQIQELRGEKGDPFVKLWKDMGGQLSQKLGLDNDSIVNTRAEVMANTTKQKALNIVKSPVELLRNVVSASEVGPRLAEFKAVLEREGFTREKLDAGERPPRHVLVEAINAAHDVTTNFKRMGYAGKVVNQIVPFTNARLESLDKSFRSIKENPKRFFIRGAAYLGSLGIAHWLMHRDEDWYKEAPAWLKYGFWTFTDDDGKPVARIPVPHHLGVTFSGGPQAILEWMSERDPKAVNEWASQLTQQIDPEQFTNVPIVKPAAEAFFNYDTFRDKPIVGQGLDKRKPADQFNPQTTELMKKIGEYLNMSPAKLEHFVEGSTGGIYGGVVGRAERAASGKLQDSDTPVVGRFMFKQDYSKTTEEFYKKKTSSEQEFNSARDRGKLTPAIEKEHKKLEELSDLMSDMRKGIRGEINRDKRFNVEKYLIGLARAGLNKDELERYPNPLKAQDLPEELKPIRDQYLGRKLYQFSSPAPQREKGEPLQKFKERQENYQEQRDRADEFLKELDLPREAKVDLLRKEGKRRGLNTQSISNGRRTAFGERLSRL